MCREETQAKNSMSNMQISEYFADSTDLCPIILSILEEFALPVTLSLVVDRQSNKRSIISSHTHRPKLSSNEQWSSVFHTQTYVPNATCTNIETHWMRRWTVYVRRVIRLRQREVHKSTDIENNFSMRFLIIFIKKKYFSLSHPPLRPSLSLSLSTSMIPKCNAQ